MASRYEDHTVTGDFLDEVPNFDIDMFSKLEELPARLTEFSESEVEKFSEGEENANIKKTLYDLKLVKKFLVEERHEIRDKNPPTELDGYLSHFVFAARTTEDWKR